MTTISDSIRRYRLLFLLAALSVLAVTALATNAAAWTTEDLDPAEKEYRSAYVYTLASEYFRGEFVQPSYTSVPVQSGYGGYMSYPVSHLDDRTHIEAASISIIARNSGSATLNVKVMDREFHELDPEIALTSIWKATATGTVSVSTGLAYRTYTISITGAALEDLRDVIAGNDDYLVIAFDLSSLGWVDLFARYIDISGTYYSTLTLEYDDEAPDVPPPVAMDPYITGDHVPVTWSPASDNPSGGNRGEVTYQVGVYLPDAPVDNPYHTSQWIDTTTWNLTGVVDNAVYTFRVRARDGSGFTSNWSIPVNTTVDNSPPTTPLLQPEPSYTRGINNTITWWPTLDIGIGNVSYEYQYSKDPEFPGEFYHFTSETSVNITDLHGTYYYRVRSVDGLGHASPWSPIERSTQDSRPPSVPILAAEPEYTQGMDNIIEWHPSTDLGAGVSYYVFEAATSPDFGNTTVFTFVPSTTTVTARGLTDRTLYYFRVRAVDALGQYSNWSSTVHSTQDASGPSLPGLWNLPRYVGEGQVTLSWRPSVDNGIGVSHYEVWWHIQGPSGSSPMVYSIEVLGQSLTLYDLGEGTWKFGIAAVDRFGQSGPWAETNTTMDQTPPTQPVLEELPEYSKGTSITLRWNRSTDESGIDYYRVVWRQSTNYASERYIDTREREVTLVDFTEGVLYWYEVIAYDMVGNWWGSPSVSCRQDASPPPAPYLKHQPDLQKKDTTTIEWSPVTDNNGMAVEYQLRGQVIAIPEINLIEFPWTTDLNRTLYDLSDLEFYQLHVVARDSLGWISEPSNEVSFGVDLTPPIVEVWTPTEGQVITGVSMITGIFKDARPNVYFIEYRSASEEEWLSIVYWTENVNPPNFYEPWDTTGLPDGDYVIRVTHVDDRGWHGYDEVSVTLANAHPTVSPTDIGFAVPGFGNATMVMVAVRNDGDAMARNLTVKFYVDSQVVETRTGVDVEAHSLEVLYFELTETGKRYIEFSVGSDLYETRSAGRFLVTEEPVKEVEDVADADYSTSLAFLALVLAAIALVIAILMSRRPPVEGLAESGKETGSTVEDVTVDQWEETPDEKK